MLPITGVACKNENLLLHNPFNCAFGVSAWILVSEGWWESWQHSPKVTGGQDKDGRPSGASLRNVILSPSSALTWLGHKKGIRSVKRWVLVCWWWQFDQRFTHLMVPVFTTISTILAPMKSRMETFWYWLTRTVPENSRNVSFVSVFQHWWLGTWFESKSNSTKLQTFYQKSLWRT